MRERRSQVPLLAKGHWCVYETLSATYTYITEYRHTHMLLISQNTLWLNLPSVHNLISDPCFSIHCACGWGKRAAALALSRVLSVHIACIFRTSLPISLLSLLMLMRLKKNRPILILSGSRSVLPLYLSVCSAQGRALTLFSQRIRHAECWGPLHTKRPGIRRKRP